MRNFSFIFSGHEWNSEEGDCLWDLCENKLLVAQVSPEFKGKLAQRLKHLTTVFAD